MVAGNTIPHSSDPGTTTPAKFPPIGDYPSSAFCHYNSRELIDRRFIMAMYESELEAALEEEFGGLGEDEFEDGAEGEGILGG